MRIVFNENSSPVCNIQNKVLDPVDGTSGFIKKGISPKKFFLSFFAYLWTGQYAVALGLMDNCKPILGVLGCPSLPLKWGEESEKGSILIGVEGEGSFQRGISENSPEVAIKVSDCEDLKQLKVTESPNSYSDSSLEQV